MLSSLFVTKGRQKNQERKRPDNFALHRKVLSPQAFLKVLLPLWLHDCSVRDLMGNIHSRKRAKSSHLGTERTLLALPGLFCLIKEGQMKKGYFKKKSVHSQEKYRQLRNSIWREVGIRSRQKFFFYQCWRGFSLPSLCFLVKKRLKLKQLLTAPSLLRNIFLTWSPFVHTGEHKKLTDSWWLFFSYEREKVTVAQIFPFSSFRLINTNGGSRTLTSHISF